jgi:glycosyltransferase involved in cell wall biosynthesis
MEVITEKDLYMSIETLKDEQPGKLNILMVFHAAPNPPPFDLGPSKRNFPFFVENLKRHNVSVLSLGSREEEERFRNEFGDKCETIVFINNREPKFIRLIRRFWYLIRGFSQTKSMVYRRKMQKALDELTDRKHYDIIHSTSVILGYYDFPRNIPTISDTHNVEFDLVQRTYRGTKEPMRKLYWYIEYRRLRKEELRNCLRFDAMLATTHRDAELWRQELPGIDVTVVQNGVDRQFLTPLSDVHPEPDTLVFVGLMEYYPNRHGILYFLENIFPLILREKPDTKLYIVGAKPTKDVLALASTNVIITGFVEDVRPYVGKSKVFVIPLLIGGGIRGKALEAMAMKIPIVSTSIGVEGIRLVKNESVLLADTPEEFSAAVISLLNDESLGEKLSERAYKDVLAYYDWTAKGSELNEVYKGAMRLKEEPSPRLK